MTYTGVVNNKWVLNHEEDIKILSGVGKYGPLCFSHDSSLCDFPLQGARKAPLLFPEIGVMSKKKNGLVFPTLSNMTI